MVDINKQNKTLLNLRSWLSQFQFPDAVFDYVNLRCFVDSGLPIFLVSVVGGGKSTLINALEEKYTYDKKADVRVERLERVSPLRLAIIQDRINGEKALFLAEDFSTIGDEEDTTYKTVLMVSKLSYDKTYRDVLFESKKHKEGLNLKVKSLAFVCGMQPLWLSIYAQKETFETIIQEKVPRYYRLPIQTIQQKAEMKVIVKYLNSLNLENKELWETKPYILNLLVNALMIQCSDRANEYAPKIIEALKRYIPEEISDEWVRQLALRFSFEEKMINKYYQSANAILPVTEVAHKEYAILYHVLFNNPIDYNMLALKCKIRGQTPELTHHYIGELVKMAMLKGFVVPLQFKNTMRVYPTQEAQKYSLHTWKNAPTKTKRIIEVVPDKPKTETDYMNKAKDEKT